MLSTIPWGQGQKEKALVFALLGHTPVLAETSTSGAQCGGGLKSLLDRKSQALEGQRVWYPQGSPNLGVSS